MLQVQQQRSKMEGIIIKNASVMGKIVHLKSKAKRKYSKSMTQSL